jgi:hypothetical protein
MMRRWAPALLHVGADPATNPGSGLAMALAGAWLQQASRAAQKQDTR